jgi:hypothetical protein
MTGYSKTPLLKKLGIKPGFIISLINAPIDYLDLFSDVPPDLAFIDDPGVKKDLIHFFTKSKNEYVSRLLKLKQQLKPDGMIWASWPKRSSKIETDISEDVIRNYAIEIGLVDIKICAVDDTWSGLKLVIPFKDRDFSA